MDKLYFDYAKDNKGNSIFESYVDTLPDKIAAKLLARIIEIEENGLQTSIKMKWIKKLDKNLYEIRTKFGSNIQRAIYFQKIGNQYIITHGFTKKTQKTPKKEIDRAKRIRKGYLGE